MRFRRAPSGLVSGSMIFSCSMIEPGHPCVTISGNASHLRTNVNEMDVQPIDLGNECGSALSFASHLRQS